MLLLNAKRHKMKVICTIMLFRHVMILHFKKAGAY